MDKQDMFATIICQNDELSSSLSLSWLDCLLTDSEVSFLFAEINQILLKFFFIPIPLNFMQKSQVKSNSNSTHHWDK